MAGGRHVERDPLLAASLVARRLVVAARRGRGGARYSPLRSRRGSLGARLARRGSRVARLARGVGARLAALVLVALVGAALGRPRSS